MAVISRWIFRKREKSSNLTLISTAKSSRFLEDEGEKDGYEREVKKVDGPCNKKREIAREEKRDFSLEDYPDCLAGGSPTGFVVDFQGCSPGRGGEDVGKPGHGKR
jgi:hypothetical protein